MNLKKYPTMLIEYPKKPLFFEIVSNYQKIFWRMWLFLLGQFDKVVEGLRGHNRKERKRSIRIRQF